MAKTVSYINESLKDLYLSTEISSFTRLIMEHVCGLSLHKLLLGIDTELSETEKCRIREIVGRLQQHEPIQYILGETNFYGLTFKVNPSVLIPRPETEELVERIITEYNEKAINVLDIGTGSGCIAIALARHLKQATVAALDISPEALEVARQNAVCNQVSVSFQEIDILSVSQTTSFLSDRKFNCIVSNPPYVMNKEKQAMEQNVLAYEPHLALFVPDEDPLLFYHTIARFGQAALLAGGHLYFEINAQCGQQTVDMLQQEGYNNIELIRDLSGNDRITKAQR